MHVRSSDYFVSVNIAASYLARLVAVERTKNGPVYVPLSLSFGVASSEDP